MPVRRCCAHAVGVAEGQVQATSVQYGEGVVSGSGYLILVPLMLIAVCWRVHQHQHPLGAIERLLGTSVLCAEINRRLFRHAAIVEKRIELAGVIGFKKDIVVVQVEA